VPAFKQTGGMDLDWDRGVPHREGAWTFTMSGTTDRQPFAGLNDDERVLHKGELICTANQNVIVAYGTDIEKATRVVNDVGVEMAADPEWHRRVMEPPHVERVEAWIVPEAVVRLRSRRGLSWPRRPSAAAYRVEAGDLRVTVLDGSVPDGRGFRIEGDARFAVEGPIGATVEVWIERQPPEEGQVLTWGERSVPLGRLPGVRVWLPLSEGASLGSTAVVAVRLRAPGVWVRFASAERHGVP